jgi:UDP-N-acetylmuramoyl-tripeptide--D-alanyl-D-alanine ligase
MNHIIFNQFLKVKKVSTDTRKILKDSIFFALKGERFNGNTFALQALQEGASMVVVDEEIESHDHRIVRTSDALKALQQLAADYRKTFQIPFLAITGSNGKTTTKELIREVLATKYRVTATIGNLNNHIGVPLTLLSIPDDCEFAIIEMGANHQGEIQSYCEYTIPDFGLITNMGKAHLEGFGGELGVIKGKKELYDYVSAHGGRLFVNLELEKLKAASRDMEIIPYGFSQMGEHLECISESPVVQYRYQSGQFQGNFTTQMVGAYNLYNIASAIAVGKYFGVEIEMIHKAICAYSPENNRSQLKQTSKNLLILDAYNANPSSLEHALLGLSKQENPQKFFVIGDMRELGEAGPEEHARIISLASDLGLKGITVGAIFKSLEDKNPFPSFSENGEAMHYLTKLHLENNIILIKGSRGIRLEELIPAL